MTFLTNGIGELVMKELSNALEARVAVAFFCPDEPLLAALNTVPKLTVIVSEEFTFNNPYHLERLTKAKLRSIPPDSENGKLHAKVLIVKRQNGSYWCLVGSANMTWHGLFKNQEACMVVNSRNSIDEHAVMEIRSWFAEILENSRSPDLEEAKSIFDERSRFQSVTRPSRKTTNGVGYWALKTTSGSTGEQHWPSFQSESVIAVGWSDIPVNPAKVSDAQLQSAIYKTYPDEDVVGAANKVRKFVDLQIDDIVLICRGYNSTQQKDVHIHGFARVTGRFRDDNRTKWEWRFKHDAVIQTVDMDLPRDLVATALGKQSLTQTIHGLDKMGFDRLAKELKKMGVHVEV